MSQQLKEFVKQSGVEISPSSVSTTASNNALNREIEAELGITRNQQFPPRLQRNMMNNENMGEFAQFVNNTNNVNNIVADVVPSPPKTLTFTASKLNPGMFNATVNKEFSAEKRIDIKKILLRTPLPKTPIGEGLYIDTKEINGIYGRFVTGFTHTREYGKKGDLTKNFFTVQVKIVITNGVESKGATVNFYENGKIRFSGGFIGTNISNQPELIRRFMVNTYTDKEAFLYSPFEYNNLSGQFRVNGVFKNMDTLAARGMRLYGLSEVKYDSELSPFMYITYKAHKYILAKSGNIQISGAPSPADMLASYTDGVEMAQMLYSKGEITLTGMVPPKLVKGKTKKIKFTPNQRAALKIDSKQCLRLAKSELVDLAKKMGVVGITASTKKDEICKKMKAMSNTKSATFRNTNKNKNVALSGSGKNFKVGRSACLGYSKTELLRVAGILKIKLEPKETKETLCKKIEKVRNAMAAPKPKPPTPPPKPKRANVAQQKLNVKKQEVIKKRGLDENSIRKDITKLYGKKWISKYKNVMPSLNSDVRELKSKLNKLTAGNKMGVPFKKNADLIKKQTVEKWKRERERNLEKKMIMNQLNTNGVNANLKNQYRVAATNYIMTKGPTMKQLENYKKTWINLRKKK